MSEVEQKLLNTSLLGEPYDAARLPEGYHTLRMVNWNGLPQLCTRDYKPGRINVWVDSRGIITKVSGVG